LAIYQASGNSLAYNNLSKNGRLLKSPSCSASPWFPDLEAENDKVYAAWIEPTKPMGEIGVHQEAGPRGEELAAA